MTSPQFGPHVDEAGSELLGLRFRVDATVKVICSSKGLISFAVICKLAERWLVSFCRGWGKKRLRVEIFSFMGWSERG